MTYRTPPPSRLDIIVQPLTRIDVVERLAERMDFWPEPTFAADDDGDLFPDWEPKEIPPSY